MCLQYSAVRKRKSIAYVACLIEFSCVCVLSAFSCVCVISVMGDGNCSPGLSAKVHSSERVISGGERTEVREQTLLSPYNSGGWWSRGGTGGQVHVEVERPGTEAEPTKQGTKAE